jgi:hypothetical protein
LVSLFAAAGPLTGAYFFLLTYLTTYKFSDDNIVIGSRKNGTQSERKRKNDGEDGEGVSKKPKKR